MSKEKNWVVKVAELFLIGILAVAVCGILVQQLWNWLMPIIFGLPTVTFWQALGVVALSWILFGFPGSRNDGGRRRRMSSEQREKFRRGLETGKDESLTQSRTDAEEKEEERGV